MRRRAVLLDALGTLVELEPPGPRLVNELRDRFGLRIAPALAERALGEEIAFYRAHLDDARDEVSLTALRRRCAAVLGEQLGAGPLDLGELTDALLSSLRFRAYPEVADALGALRSRGLCLAVVSNWDVSLPRVLEQLGLGALLDAVFTSAGVGARKPAPAIFHEALRALGVDAADAIHVGDSLEEDVAGARAAGIEPVLVLRGSGSAGTPLDGVRRIAALDQLDAIAGGLSCAPVDEGLPIAYHVLGDGVPVFAAEGGEVGRVDHVVAAPEQDIFHGVIIRVSGALKFVAAEDVASLHERGVDLRLAASEIDGLPAPDGAAPVHRVSEPGIKPSHWKQILDLLTGANPHRRDWTDEE